MSPALLKKYLAAARDIANHVFLNAGRLRTSRRTRCSPDVDRDKYCSSIASSTSTTSRTPTTPTTSAPRGATSTAPRWAGRARRSPASPPRPRSARSTWRRSGTCSKGRGRPSVRSPASRRVWRALPAPGPRASDTAAGGREALRDYIEALRAKIEPRFLNLVAGRRQRGAAAVHDLEERPVRDASHDVRSAAAAGRGRADGRRPMSVRSRAASAVRAGPTPLIVNAAGRSGSGRAGRPARAATRRRSRGSAASSRTCSTWRSAAATTSTRPRIAAAISTPASTA